MKRVYQISLNQRTHQVELIQRTDSSLTFVVNETSYTVAISTPLTLNVHENSSNPARILAAPPAVATSASAGSVIAPMPGIVARVLCSIGEIVKRGDALVVIEAMKMENNIGAPGAGKIINIGISAGDEVRKGQVLIEIEVTE